MKMKAIRGFTVAPALPPALERQQVLIYNLRWAWHHDAIELFRWDNALWERSGHNPVKMLGMIDQTTLAAAAADDGFLSHLDRVAHDFDSYLNAKSTWFSRTAGNAEPPLIAYFSAEFGITDCLSIFAGGLGILAGDHLKSASDLGLPMVGVGLLYQQGYFRQYLNEAGWQQEVYVNNDFHTLPLTLERHPDGKPVLVEVPFPNRTIKARIWRAQVGRVPLYLLDSNIPDNPDKADQDITDQLYGGDLEMRMRQEILLGIGGFRALAALGLTPSVYHLNEGHSAFLVLERIRHLMEVQNLSFAEAREAASAGLLFTTHTPVPAGHDFFSQDLMERYFSAYARRMGLSFHELMSLGKMDPDNNQEPFCMTTLALRLAHVSNGVSRLHGEVSRRMWQSLWPGVPEEEVPIGHVDNGVHFRSWISAEMDELYNRYLGQRWHSEPADQALWAKVRQISSEELWRTHELRRERLVAFARRKLRAQLKRRGATQAEIEAADETLRPDALTIGFARRFATYKRATLLFRDPERLARLLNHPDRPVQLIFAGQAHPHDDAGKELIQQIVNFCRRPEFRHKMVFLEGDDMAITRSMVQGTDVWLNTPRRPLEASGTSGMKAAANGVLNLSTLDGWWDDAWRRAEAETDDDCAVTIGWAIGRGEVYDDPEEQDQIEAEALYALLERDVVPCFYERNDDNLPRHWIAAMKSSIGALCHYFNTHRMVREYTERFYLPGAAHYDHLAAEGMARAKALAAWKQRVKEHWPQVRFESFGTSSLEELRVGQEVNAHATLHLGPLTPEDVSVELVLGIIDSSETLLPLRTYPMKAIGGGGAGSYRFEAEAITCQNSGLHGVAVRAVPHHSDLATKYIPGLILWAGSEVK